MPFGMHGASTFSAYMVEEVGHSPILFPTDEILAGLQNLCMHHSES